jgi:HK97 family phage prohead protease
MAVNKTEIRTFRSGSLRSMSQGDDMVIAGRALSYNTLSNDLGGFKERLQPGCFSRHLATAPDVLCRREHETGFLLGRTQNGSLTLQDGPDGLDFRCAIDPNDPIAVSTHAAIKSGLIDSCSFCFAVDGDDGQDFSGPDQRTGLLTRTIKRAKILDVAPVAVPAYPQGTSVAARAHYSTVDEQAEVKKQIAAFEKLQADKKRQSIATARSRFAEYSPLSAEEIVRCKKLGYSEDLMLELRCAAYARQIRAGVAFEAEPMRYSGGASEDPELKFRDDEGQIWPEAARTTEEHEQSAKYHANCASKAKSLHEAEFHYHCADRHKFAAEHPNDTLASDRARESSRLARS